MRITIDTGVLAGSAADGIQTFKGIPYAKPPVGPLRWRPPQPPAAWKEARDATAFGAACPLGGAALEGDGLQTSEDCLTLNVWAPAHADRSSPGAPVMVWLHGGANSNGAGAKRYYDGTAFARDGIVLVSLNYRLGPLGFFAHPALTKEAGPSEPLGSYGLMDQVAALGWVKRNARAFGGDPARVTVFGESAGGEDVLALLAVPSATGLFQQAIVESGPGWPK
ncbi:MAG TPA: carboxylesterase family protein, partial [Thermoanaerobaculia bacterium]